MCMVAGPVMHALINLQCQCAFSFTVVCFQCGLIFSVFKFKKTVMAGIVAKEKKFPVVLKLYEVPETLPYMYLYLSTFDSICT